MFLFFYQVARLNASYPGGLTSYIKTARELLADSKAGRNPFDGFMPSLDPLLRTTGYPDGDVNYETGYSPFPGNINQVMETWMAYAPVKNDPEDAAKVPKGNPYHSATSGEMAIYRANSLILRKAGVHIDNPVQQVFNGQEVGVWPRITWRPKWGLTFAKIKSKVDGSCSISQRSTLVIKGCEVFLEDLSLDGALVINSVEDTEVKVGGSVQNRGWILENVDYKDTSVPE